MASTASMTSSGSGSGSGSGFGSGSGSGPKVRNSGSDGDLQVVLDQRKKRRMLSNRESARRSRMRKQKHLDDLAGQAAQLRDENGRLLHACRSTSRDCSALEAENSVLRAQLQELTRRMQSLGEVVSHISNRGGSNSRTIPPAQDNSSSSVSSMMNTWNLASLNHPILTSPDMFLY